MLTLVISLVATIRKRRPDLLTEHEIVAEPIDTEPPESFFKSINERGVEGREREKRGEADTNEGREGKGRPEETSRLRKKTN